MSLRQLPPAAATISLPDIASALVGALRPQATRSAVEAELASSFGVDSMTLVSSGRAALVLILNTLRELRPGRTGVIIPAYSCFSVPAAVVKAGLRVKLCDIDPATLDFDFTHLDALLAESDTLCVVSTHLFGMRADVRRARALAAPRHAFVVDDAAQAFGTMMPDGAAGTFGDVGLFSFGRGKAVTTVHGGAIACGTPEITQRIRAQVEALPEPGVMTNVVTVLQAVVLMLLLRPWLYWLPASLPFLRLGETVFSTSFAVARMPGAAAGLLRRWRVRADQGNAARSKWAALIATGVPGLRCPATPCIRLPIVCASPQERTRLIAAGNRSRLGFTVMYPASINAVPELQDQLTPRPYPNAERMAKCLMTVPVHSYLSDSDSQQIAGLLRSATLMELRS